MKTLIKHKLTPKVIATFFVLLALPVIKGCIEPFTVPETGASHNFLVVDGFLNTGGIDTTIITLSRTQALSETTMPQSVTGAKVTIQGKSGTSYPFTEIGSGRYRLLPRIYAAADQYRIIIQTPDGKLFESDYESVTKAPPIDSVYYEADANRGIRIMVDTHDPANSTHFYRWDYKETWMYRTPYSSSFEKLLRAVFPNGKEDWDIIERQTPIDLCYKDYRASSIILGTSIKLSKDIIQGAAIAYVPASSGKLQIKYSINLNQYGMTHKEYKYWSEVAKTTERNGTLFDALPSLVTGNIRCTTDPSESVFGYFRASTPATKRVFFTPYMGYPDFCSPPDTLPKDSAIIYPGLVLQYLDEPRKYTVAPYECADCRLKGGYIQRPPYWK